MFNAFITGSRVYGCPTKESDIDVVIKMNQSDMDKMIKTNIPEKVKINGE